MMTFNPIKEAYLRITSVSVSILTIFRARIPSIAKRLFPFESVTNRDWKEANGREKDIFIFIVLSQLSVQIKTLRGLDCGAKT